MFIQPYCQAWHVSCVREVVFQKPESKWKMRNEAISHSGNGLAEYFLSSSSHERKHQAPGFFKDTEWE